MGQKWHASLGLILVYIQLYPTADIPECHSATASVPYRINGKQYDLDSCTAES